MYANSISVYGLFLSFTRPDLFSPLTMYCLFIDIVGEIILGESRDILNLNCLVSLFCSAFGKVPVSSIHWGV